MKRGLCIGLFLVLLTVFCVPITGFAQENTTLFTFASLDAIKSLNTDGTTGKASSNPAKYEDNVLTLSSSSAENLFLVEAKVPESIDKFTIHVEISVPVYAANTTLEAIVLLGETRHTLNHHRFEVKDSVRGDTANRPVYVRYQRRSTNDYLETTTQKSTNVKFNSGEWIALDLLVDETNKSVAYYLNGALVDTVTNINTSALPLDGRIGFRGKGVSFKNLIVSSGLLAPQPTAPSPSATPTPVATTAPAVTVTPSATASVTTTPVATATPETNNPITADPMSTVVLLSLIVGAIVVVTFCVLKKNRGTYES